MEQLRLAKALADDSRHAIYLELRRAGVGLSAGDLAERLELHPNTVRLHLERLREVGLVEASTTGDGSVGRPQHHWGLTAQAPSLGLERGAFRLLAHLLAEVAASAPPDPGVLAGVGHRAGRGRAAAPPAPQRAVIGAAPQGAVSGAAARRILDELADLGFDPVADPPTLEGTVPVAFTSCPFRELATAYPDLVCGLHRGVTEGIVAAVAEAVGTDAKVASFSSLVDVDPCRAELAFER